MSSKISEVIFAIWVVLKYRGKGSGGQRDKNRTLTPSLKCLTISFMLLSSFLLPEIESLKMTSCTLKKKDH